MLQYSRSYSTVQESVEGLRVQYRYGLVVPGNRVVTISSVSVSIMQYVLVVPVARF